MTKEQKLQSIKTLTSVLSSKNIYFADISGINANKISEFRRNCYDSQVQVRLVKNTLLRKAMESHITKWSPLFCVIQGNTFVMTSEVNNVPAKIIRDFKKKNHSDKPLFLGAYVEESFYLGYEQFETLVNIKSKKELISDVISLLHFPIKKIISTLKSVDHKILGCLEILSRGSPKF
ncbi:MAG: 50S ribosomal protein L10 [Candidatus Walczuchella monophlebidarum]